MDFISQFLWTLCIFYHHWLFPFVRTSSLLGFFVPDLSSSISNKCIRITQCTCWGHPFCVGWVCVPGCLYCHSLGPCVISGIIWSQTHPCPQGCLSALHLAFHEWPYWLQVPKPEIWPHLGFSFSLMAPHLISYQMLTTHFKFLLHSVLTTTSLCRKPTISRKRAPNWYLPIAYLVSHPR